MTRNALQTGDEIRVIAPSFSREKGYEGRDERARKRLEGLGYTVTFGMRLDAQYYLGTASPEDRAQDFHDALADNNVRLIMAYSGGWSANEMLPKIDWDLVKSNPKPFMGYSDTTVLLNAIYAKTGTVCYLGPNFGTLGEMTSWEYTLHCFDEVLRHELPVPLKPSEVWGEAPENIHTTAWRVLQEGEAEAILIGGNFNTFHLLQGTEYQPKFDEPFILLAEDDDESGQLTARYFSRRLESILQLPHVRQNLKGVIIGRFLSGSKFSEEDLAKIITSKQLGNIPVVSNMDFGHTLPILTLPIGGRLKLMAKGSNIEMKVVG